MAKGPKKAEKEEVLSQEVTAENATPNPYREQYDADYAKLDALSTELKDKKYLIEANEELIKKLHNYITVSAPWKGVLSFGIVEIARLLEVCISKKKLFVDSVAVEAIHHFLTTVEGNGLKGGKGLSAVETKTLIASVLSTKETISTDLKAQEELAYRVSSWAQGINPDEEQKEVNLTNE